jgi:hypothetical protein
MVLRHVLDFVDIVTRNNFVIKYKIFVIMICGAEIAVSIAMGYGAGWLGFDFL